MSGERMSSDRGDRVTTDSEFEAAIENLLAAAARNGVDPRGSCVCETGVGPDTWEVMIYELE